jgi:protein involved in polysaccharide export with SLBB domain
MRLLQHRVRPFLRIAGLAAATFVLTGCPTTNPPPPPKPPQQQDPSKADMIPFQIGDTLTVDLTGTPAPIPQISLTLSGAGTINLPLLETNIPAIGKTPHELEQIIHDLYVPSQFTHINVVVTPGVRFYVVQGQINNTGSGKQIYDRKTTVLGAIGTAGGFNPFAARKRVQLTRQDGTIFIEDCTKALKDPKLDLEVLPGDKIFVDQETFWEAGSHAFGK